MEQQNESIYVRRGSKGIALIDPKGDTLKLRYVFDVSDTGGRENSRRPYLWEVRNYHEQPILEMLKDRYDISDNRLSDAFYNIAQTLAKEYYDIHKRDIPYLAENSFLEKYDEDNIRIVFENATTVSIAYTLMKRCGLKSNEYFEQEDFLNIFSFNTPDIVALLGTVVSEQSQQVFRQIAFTISKMEYERGNEHEQTYLQKEWGLSDTRPQTDGTDSRQQAAELLGQIRENEERIPSGASNTVVPFVATEREVVSTSIGGRSVLYGELFQLLKVRLNYLDYTSFKADYLI